MDYAAVALNILQYMKTALWPFCCVYARIFGAIMVFVLFPSKNINQLLKASLAFILALIITPSLINQLKPIENLFINICLIYLNYIYGCILGYLLSFPIWLVEACGNVIDMQRGEQIGALLNPSTGDPSSSIGGLLTRAFVTYFVLNKGILYFIGTIFGSFQFIAVTNILPAINGKSIEHLISIFSLYLYWSIDLVLPIIITLLLIDIILSLINSFIQQLNVTILSMPIKSMIAILILCIYLEFLFHSVFLKFITETKILIF